MRANVWLVFREIFPAALAFSDECGRTTTVSVAVTFTETGVLRTSPLYSGISEEFGEAALTQFELYLFRDPPHLLTGKLKTVSLCGVPSTVGASHTRRGTHRT